MDTHVDIREDIFRKCLDTQITGILTAEAPGVLSGIERARLLMASLGLSFETKAVDGDTLQAQQEIARVTGNPVQIARAEEKLIGTLSKFSGIATAARTALQKADGNFDVVSGGWKKMPFELKEPIRQAVRDGGLKGRICDAPFIYLDKNYVRILGGVGKAVETALTFNRTIVVQIKAENGTADDEAVAAVKAGAAVIMVDTGNYEHLKQVGRVLRESGLRSRARLAFAGNIRLSDLEALSRFDLDLVDVGYAILDAPCLPMRFDVTGAARGSNR
ncbi:MAG: quinolinate phosphoribosyl transferase [Thermodesulfobacteriota bacterium]